MFKKIVIPWRSMSHGTDFPLRLFRRDFQKSTLSILCRKSAVNTESVTRNESLNHCELSDGKEITAASIVNITTNHIFDS
jgi:hypothetical protein